MPNILRLILGFGVLGGAVTLMVFGFWGWGILTVFISLLILLTYLFNENMLIAQWHLRKQNMVKAQKALDRITDYEKQLIRPQHGFYNLLVGLMEWQRAPLQSEKYFKKALKLGIQTDHYVALANLNLAGICIAKRNKREAQVYLAEAKKKDKSKLLADQIKQIKDQIGMIDKQQQVRYR